MDVKLTDAAVEDRKELDEKQWKEIKNKIKEAAESLTHEDLKLIPNPLLKHSVWQLTVKEEKTNHRVFLDVKNGKTVVLAIWNFEYTHSGDQHWKELKNRM